MDHLSLVFQSCKTENCLIGHFYNHSQKPRETDDAFADELRVLMCKITVHKPHFMRESKSGPQTLVHTQFALPLLLGSCRGIVFNIP